MVGRPSSGVRVALTLALGVAVARRFGVAVAFLRGVCVAAGLRVARAGAAADCGCCGAATHAATEEKTKTAASSASATLRRVRVGVLDME